MAADAHGAWWTTGTMVSVCIGRIGDDAGSYDVSVSLSTLELPGLGLDIAAGANIAANWSVQQYRRAHECAKDQGCE